jgi:site-specific DNA-methyltransferase (adenine-specific)
MIELDKIYNEDCLQGMKRIDDATIDCIITDLPYGTTRHSWDSVIPLDEMWMQFKRIVKERGSIALFCQQPFTSTLIMSNPTMFKYELIWEKEEGTGKLNANFAPMKSHENIAVFSKSAASFVKDVNDAMVYNPQFGIGKPYTTTRKSRQSHYDAKSMAEVTTTVNDGRRYPLTVLKFARDLDGFHPTQKPVDLLRYLVLTYTNPNDVVLDATIGSGTTAIACIKEHRHFVGFELNKEYFDRAVKRINDERRQLSLF